MTELYIKLGIAAVGVLVLLSSVVDFQSLVARLIFRKKKAVIVNNIPEKKAEQDRQSEFLDIVSLWYQLKNKCDHFNLHVASDKLDEVFPLLNGVLEDEKVS